jgi:hypothetical protein
MKETMRRGGETPHPLRYVIRVAQAVSSVVPHLWAVISLLKGAFLGHMAL